MSSHTKSSSISKSLNCRNTVSLSCYPESLKSLPFGVDLILLLEQYRGQQTTIARKLCLHSFRHLRHKSLYVLLPVLGLMKKSHSCFNLFDNLAIKKLLSLIWTKGAKMHTQNRPIFQNFFEKIYPLTCLKWETLLGGCF